MKFLSELPLLTLQLALKRLHSIFPRSILLNDSFFALCVLLSLFPFHVLDISSHPFLICQVYADMSMDMSSQVHRKYLRHIYSWVRRLASTTESPRRRLHSSPVSSTPPINQLAGRSCTPCTCCSDSVPLFPLCAANGCSLVLPEIAGPASSSASSRPFDGRAMTTPEDGCPGIAAYLSPEASTEPVC